VMVHCRRFVIQQGMESRLQHDLTAAFFVSRPLWASLREA
jgi:hypothetical protein